MKRVIAFALAALVGLPAGVAGAASGCIAPDTLDDFMQTRVKRTVEVGFESAGRDRPTHEHVEVSITLEDVLENRPCSWSVELLLPPGFSMKAGESNEETAKARGDTATFEVHVEDHYYDVQTDEYGVAKGEDRTLVGAFVVKVFSGSSTTPIFPASDVGRFADGEGRYHFPVRFFVRHTNRQ